MAGRQALLGKPIALGVIGQYFQRIAPAVAEHEPVPVLGIELSALAAQGGQAINALAEIDRQRA
jgi:hypothetical protein